MSPPVIFPGSSIADEPERLPPVDRERDVADGVRRPAPREELHLERLDLEQAGAVAVHHTAPVVTVRANRRSRCIGSAVMRIQLAKRFAPSTVSESAMPGNVITHQALKM